MKLGTILAVPVDVLATPRHGVAVPRCWWVTADDYGALFFVSGGLTKQAPAVTPQYNSNQVLAWDLAQRLYAGRGVDVGVTLIPCAFLPFSIWDPGGLEFNLRGLGSVAVPFLDRGKSEEVDG